MNRTPAFKQNITKFILDVLIFVGFLLALDPRVTGIAIHEWLTIAGTAAILLHFLLNWNWISGLTRHFLRKSSTKTRLNYILNWLFFIDGVLVMLTGVMISEVVLPQLGLQAARNMQWRQLHSLTADWSLILLGLHLALNWDWVVHVVKRYILRLSPGVRLEDERIPTADEVQP
jgi:hypothetical protein